LTELLVPTKKGLFALQRVAGQDFAITARAFAGEPVEYAMRDPRTGRVLAAVTSPFYGPKIFYADDPAGGWEQAEGVALPEGGDQALERIWVIDRGEVDGVLYAGGDPGVLFESADGGASWELNAGLWEEPTRGDWQPGGGMPVSAFDLHLAGRPAKAGGGYLGCRRMALRGRGKDMAAGRRRP
jgi:hypothetical protein